jgi:uncharacterized repeat protein (TIGR01451 family)
MRKKLLQFVFLLTFGLSLPLMSADAVDWMYPSCEQPTGSGSTPRLNGMRAARDLFFYNTGKIIDDSHIPSNCLGKISTGWFSNQTCYKNDCIKTYAGQQYPAHSGTLMDEFNFANGRNCGATACPPAPKARFSSTMYPFARSTANVQKGDHVRVLVYLHNNAEEQLYGDPNYENYSIKNANVELDWSNPDQVKATIDSNNASTVISTTNFPGLANAGLTFNPEKVTVSKLLPLGSNPFWQEYNVSSPHVSTTKETAEITFNRVYSSYVNVTLVYFDLEVIEADRAGMTVEKHAFTQAGRPLTPEQTHLQAGDTYSFQITANNTGNVALNNVTATDVLSPEFIFTGTHPGVSYNTSNRTVTLDFGTIPASSSVARSFNVIVDPATRIARLCNPRRGISSVTATGTAALTPATNISATATKICFPVDKADEVYDLVKSAEDLNGDPIPNGAILTPGQSFDYILAVQNNGIAPLYGVDLTDVLDSNLNFISTPSPSSVTYSAATHTVTLDFPSVGVGQTETLRFRVQVDPSTANGTQICNYAERPDPPNIGDDDIDSEDLNTPDDSTAFLDDDSNVFSKFLKPLGKRLFASIYGDAKLGGNSMPIGGARFSKNQEATPQKSNQFNDFKGDRNSLRDEVIPKDDSDVELNGDIPMPARALAVSNVICFTVQGGTGQGFDILKVIRDQSGLPFNPGHVLNNGDFFQYQIIVSNITGTGNITVTDVLPANFLYISSTPTATVTGQTLTWSVNPANGSTQTLLVGMQVDPTLNTNGNTIQVCNTATGVRGTVVEDSTVCIDVLGNGTGSGITITKEIYDDHGYPFPPGTILAPGTHFEYFLTITGTTNPVTVVDVLSPDLIFDYASGGGVYNAASHSVSWSITPTNPQLLHIGVLVDPNLSTPVQICNEATVDDGSGPVGSNQVCIDASGPGLSVTKEILDTNGLPFPAGQVLNPGQTFFYNIVISGTTVPINIIDVLDPNINYVSSFPTGNYNSSTHTLDWNFPPTNPQIVEIGVEVDPNLTGTVSICNEAEVDDSTTIVTSPQVCIDASDGGSGPVCGNNITEPPEECDDGNTISGDGCSATCTLESVCGNFIIEPPEQCDDGNTISGDGCSATCMTEGSGGGGGGGSAPSFPTAGICKQETSGTWSCQRAYPDWDLDNEQYLEYDECKEVCLEESKPGQDCEAECLAAWSKNSGYFPLCTPNDGSFSTEVTYLIPDVYRDWQELWDAQCEPVIIEEPPSCTTSCNYLDVEVQKEVKKTAVAVDEDANYVIAVTLKPKGDAKFVEIPVRGLNVYDVSIPGNSGWLWNRELADGVLDFELETDTTGQGKNYFYNTERIKVTNSKINLIIPYKMLTALSVEGSDTDVVSNVAFATVDYIAHYTEMVNGTSVNKTESKTLSPVCGDISDVNNFDSSLGDDASIQIIRPRVELSGGNLGIDSNENEDINDLGSGGNTETIPVLGNRPDVFSDMPKKSTDETLFGKSGFEAIADDSGVYFYDENLSLSGSHELDRSVTIVIEEGDLVINEDFTLEGDNFAAFIVQNGNIIIDKTVTKLDGLFIAEGGEIRSTGKSDKQLQISGSLVGDARHLIKNRKYIGIETMEAGISQAPQPSIVINFDWRLLENTPPALEDFLGSDWGQPE